jgi:hypothetical protein
MIIYVCIYIYQICWSQPLNIEYLQSKAWLSVGSIHVGDLGKGMSMSNPKLNMGLSKKLCSTITIKKNLWTQFDIE